MQKTSLIAVGLLTAALAAPEIPQASALPSVEGRWLTEKRKTEVELFACGGELCGRISWLAKPLDKSGKLKRDAENPDPSLRERPWCGITVITGLRETKPGVWDGGTFYFPKDGRRYDIDLRVTGDGLRVRAYLVVPMLGKKEDWTRAEGEPRSCDLDRM